MYKKEVHFSHEKHAKKINIAKNESTKEEIKNNWEFYQ